MCDPWPFLAHVATSAIPIKKKKTNDPSNSGQHDSQLQEPFEHAASFENLWINAPLFPHEHHARVLQSSPWKSFVVSTGKDTL